MRNQWLNDITDRIPEPPKWWLEGIPRYCDYHPSHFFCPPTQALVHVRCLGCYQGFDVAYGFWNSTGMNLPDAEVLQAIDGYSDEPPFHLRATDGFACAGLSSGVEVELVLQVWQRHALEWVRCAHLEGDMPCL